MMTEYLELTIMWFALLFAQYVLLMELAAKFGKDPIWMKPLIILFVIQDYIVNWLLSPIFIDPPNGLNELVTGRMKRYKKCYEKEQRSLDRLERWRLGFAVKLCKHLNRYDKGHC